MASAELPAAAAAGAVPSDKVQCVFDQLSSDDREMALLLFQREVASGAKYHGSSRNLKVIDRLVDEARARCSAPFDWSLGRSDAATSYAMNELMRAGMAQALDSKGRGTAPIETYFEQHRAELMEVPTITGAPAEQFRTFLFGQGWSKTETASLGLAEFYLAALATRARQAQSFAAAPARELIAAKRKVSAPPSRAKTARRDKP